MIANILILFFLFICLANPNKNYAQELKDLNKLAQKLSKINPGKFSMWVSGIKTHIPTQEKIIALTFDACGGKKGSGYNEKLMAFLQKEKIPATLFISGTWIDANPEIFKALSRNPLFEVENHGTNHKPCSSLGKSAYKIKGTQTILEMLEEIEFNALKIKSLTGTKPRFYRSGTAHYDKVCVSALDELGYQGVNFTVASDDTTKKNSAEKIKKNILKVKNGGIILMHFNQPTFKTDEALKEAYPLLKERGFKFVLLKDYHLK